MLAAIGETFETPYVPASDSSSSPSSPAAPLPSTFADEVTGVIVSSRKAFYRISLWTRSSAPEDRAKLENIGRQFKYSVLGLNAAVSISQSDKVSSEVEFMSHADSQTKVSWTARGRSAALISFLVRAARPGQGHQVHRMSALNGGGVCETEGEEARGRVGRQQYSFRLSNLRAAPKIRPSSIVTSASTSRSAPCSGATGTRASTPTCRLLPSCPSPAAE